MSKVGGQGWPQMIDHFVNYFYMYTIWPPERQGDPVWQPPPELSVALHI